MSLRIQPPAPAIPNRCQLFGPGSRAAIFPKMAASPADVVNLDLEDSVAPDDKAAAREAVAAATREIDWGRKALSVRINGLDTPWWHRDVIAVVEAGGRVDRIMIPKVGSAADVYAVEALLAAAEAEAGREAPIALEVIVESAAGLAHVQEIAAASPRLVAMSLGAADFAASMGMATTGIGGTQEDYYMLHGEGRSYADPWHWAQAAIVAACRTHHAASARRRRCSASDAAGVVGCPPGSERRRLHQRARDFDSHRRRAGASGHPLRLWKPRAKWFVGEQHQKLHWALVGRGRRHRSSVRHQVAPRKGSRRPPSISPTPIPPAKDSS